MKSFLAILLLFVVGFHQVGYYFVAKFQRQEIRKQVKAMLASVPSEELTIISYTDNQTDIIWEDDDKGEFFYRNKMYDVVRRKIVNGKDLLYCLTDEREKELVDKYSTHAGQHSTGSKKQKGPRIHIPLLFVNENEAFSPVLIIISQSVFAFYTTDLLNGKVDIIFPPPKA